MSKKPNTKRALLLSALCMVLCVSMLVGSTFAWFTDNATTNVNTIQAGTLDIDLVDEKGNSVAGQTLNFLKPDGSNFAATDMIEPGGTYKLPAVKIVNNGNLAVKFKMTVNGLTGDAGKLAEVLEVMVPNPDTTAAEKYISAGTLASLNKDDDGIAHGVLLPSGATRPTGADANYVLIGETAPMSITLHMMESAGNDYQKLALKDISLTVVATQYTYETDSIDNQYDANASYPVASQAELDKAIKDAQPGEVLQLTDNIYTLNSNIDADYSLAGNGPEKTTVKVPTNTVGSRTTGLMVNAAGATISGMTLEKTAGISSDEYAAVVAVKAGNTTLDNVVVNSSGKTSAVVVDRFDQGTVTIANSTLTSGFKTIHIVDHANGKVVINNSDITGVYTFNVNSGTSQNLEIEVTNSKLHGWTSYGNIKSATFTNTEFSKGSSNYDYCRPYADTVFTGCTFDSEFKLGAGAALTMTLNDCYFNGTKLTAENIYSMLDVDSTLRSCTITVDGIQVTNFGA